MTDKLIIETAVMSVEVLTVGSQGPQGPEGIPGTVDDAVLSVMNDKIASVRTLSETNQLNISKKADQLDLEQSNQQVELNRLSLLQKADLTALAMLSMLIDTKADQNYVNQQIANILNNDQEMIATINEIN